MRHEDGAVMWLADAAGRESVSEKFMVHLGSGPKLGPLQTYITVVTVRHR